MKKRVLFLLCDACICGGTYVILEHASRLQKMGYDVTVALVFMKMDVFSLFKQPPMYWHPALKSLRFIHIDDAHQEQYDVAIYTLWSTLYFEQKVNAKQSIYFVQSIESRFFSADQTFLRNQVIKTYQLGLPVITEASWIKAFLEQNFSSNCKLAKNGIDKTRYTLEGPCISERKSNQLRILVEGPTNVPYKNVEKTLQLCKQANVGEVWLLTSTQCESHSCANRVFSKIPVDQVPAIYRSCDVLVKLSYVEGMFGPPLEMFHCGGTAIVYDVTGHDEYIIHNENALVAKTDDEASVINYLKILANDQQMLMRLKQGAINTARNWLDWDQSTQHFADAMEKLTSEANLHYTNNSLADRLQEKLPVTFYKNQEQVEATLPISVSGAGASQLQVVIPIFPGNTIIDFHFGKRYEKFFFTRLDFHPMQQSCQKPEYQISLIKMVQKSNNIIVSQSLDSISRISINTPEHLPKEQPSFYFIVEYTPITLACTLPEIAKF